MMYQLKWLTILEFVLLCEIVTKGGALRIDNSHRHPRSSSRISERKCEEYTRGTTCKDYVNPNAVENAKLGEFPHLAFIAANNSNHSFVCTGSLISPRFVLTAAHCITQERLLPLFVSLGDHNIDPSVDDGATPVQIPVKTIIKHPEYKPPTVYNDIGLLELASDVTFSARIRPACVWTQEKIDENVRAVISTIDGTPDPKLRQHEIQKVSVTLKDKETCDELGAKKNFWDQGLIATQLCGQEATGTNPYCKAMGGSPVQIVTDENNSCKFHVIGLTSFGLRKCQDNPTVFTRVSSYMDWIESIVWP